MSQQPRAIMEMTEVAPADRPLVTGYRENGFTIGESRFEGALLLLPERYLAVAARGFDELDETILGPVLAPEADIALLLLGGGARLRFPGQSLQAALEAAEVAFEPMDSRAAARSFNMLVSEERRVAALLLPVGAG